MGDTGSCAQEPHRAVSGLVKIYHNSRGTQGRHNAYSKSLPRGHGSNRQTSPCPLFQIGKYFGFVMTRAGHAKNQLAQGSRQIWGMIYLDFLISPSKLNTYHQIFSPAEGHKLQGYLPQANYKNNVWEKYNVHHICNL